jgi:hypothetical protein
MYQTASSVFDNRLPGCLPHCAMIRPQKLCIVSLALFIWSSATVVAFGQYTFTDAAATNSGPRYYRAVAP